MTIEISDPQAAVSLMQIIMSESSQKKWSRKDTLQLYHDCLRATAGQAPQDKGAIIALVKKKKDAK